MADAEIKTLKNHYKSEGDAGIRGRILFIIWFRPEQSGYDVAERMFCPQSKVMHWKKRFEESGNGSLKTETKSRRPSLMNENVREEIRRELSGMDHW